MFVKEITSNAKLNSVHSGIYVTKNNPVWTTIQDWFLENIQNGVKPTPAVSRLLSCGILLGFNQNDFINASCYKGTTKLYKCNSTKPKYFKKYLGKDIGMVYMLGFKHTDYDNSTNYLLVSNIKFLHILKGKMIEEFPEYPFELYSDNYEYNRAWENIRGLTPQEKIVLANAHNEEPFPNSYYENDRGYFSQRTQSDEKDIRFELEISDVDIRDYDIRDYEGTQFESTFDIIDKIIAEREISFNEVNEGYDYGDSQEFSDIYTRTPTAYEDYELYPIRVNCMPKAVRKRGRSPYDTKLGVRSYIWHNMYAKPEPLEDKDWVCNPVSAPSSNRVKYDWEMSKEEKLADEYNLPDNFWEEIEMAYQQR